MLGLSSSSAVRLVDGLEADGYVQRSTGKDGHVTLVELTPAGRRRARAITERRAAVLDDMLAPLDETERRQLGVLAGKMLAGLIRPPGATRWTCRLCDTVRCGRELGFCPVYEAAKNRYGVAGQPPGIAQSS